MDWFVQTLTHVFEATLPDKLVPDRFGVLMGRCDGDDSGLASAAGGAVTEARFRVKPGKLEPLLERFYRSSQLLG